MTPGPTLIKRCSACTRSIAQHTIGSGNTFGATYWTDGRRQAPMLPDEPALVLCPHCRAPVWLDELDVLEERWPGDRTADRLEGATEYRRMSFEDYVAVLAEGKQSSEKERYLRVQAWWEGNDRRRAATDAIPMTAAEASNLAALAGMLDEAAPHDLMMKAEAMRELGRFEAAKTLLERSTDPRMAPAVRIIRSLADRRDPYVREMHFR